MNREQRKILIFRNMPSKVNIIYWYKIFVKFSIIDLTFFYAEHATNAEA